MKARLSALTAIAMGLAPLARTDVQPNPPSDSPSPTPVPSISASPSSAPTPAPGSNDMLYVVVGLSVAAVGGVAIFFLARSRPKQ